MAPRDERQEVESDLNDLSLSRVICDVLAPRVRMYIT